MSAKPGWLRSAPLIGLGVAYAGWAAGFIARSAIDVAGARYFCLFDDAMVSLRYAWNLAHGDGLVWNPGERVEGITSFLFTLHMALGALFFHKSGAALFVQLTGIVLVLGAALMASRLSRALSGTRALGWLTAAAVLAYYPLSYWSLMGMETGLLSALALSALLLALRLDSRPRGSWPLGLLLGLMFATRPDAAVPAGVILVFRGAWIVRGQRRPRALVPWLVEPALFAGMIGALTLFRFAYYGSLVPNTYLLKMSNWPLLPRLRNGWHFVGPFLDTSRYLLLLALCSVLLHRERRRLLLSCFGGSVIACQVWVGGDAWPYWRMLVPGVLALLVLAADGGSALLRRLLRADRAWLTLAFSGACLAWALWQANQPFMPELRREIPAYMVNFNQSTVEAGIELSRYADARASVAVAAAGAVTYYSGARGIDILGKSDRYIAGLPGLGFEGQTVTPGHNKFDLRYSIKKLRPDAIYDALAWSRYTGGDIFEFVQHNYVQRGSFWLRRGSPYLHWERVPPQ